MKKYTKSIPEFVYLIEEGAWFAGPFVHPQKGRMNRKFKLVEVQEQPLNTVNEAMAFAEWKFQNRWFNFENGYWFYTFEGGTAISEAARNKHYRKTTAELYKIFKEQTA